VLDRDGTVIVERHYLSDPDKVELLAGVAASLRRLKRMGLGLVVITNQSGIGRGYFSESRVEEIHRRMNELLRKEQVRVDGIYICPHRPQDGCACRKPGTALVESAAAELRFDAQASFVIGDNACDIEMGHRVGATTFLVRTGYGARVEAEGAAVPDYVVGSIEKAVPMIERMMAGAMSGRGRKS